MSEIIDFQLGKGTDSQNRTIEEIWQLDNFWLEHDHKYIQWLFPMDSQTKFNLHAPILTESDIALFKSSPELANSLKMSLKVMLNFFGMEWEEEGNTILPSKSLNIREHIWLKSQGHNHKRISRISRSLYLCGQADLSRIFVTAMLAMAEQYGEVNEESKSYWRASIT